MKRTQIPSLLLLAVLSLAASAASVLAQDVTYNAMPGTDFSRFKSYRWVVIGGASHPDQIIDKQITQAIDAELAAKGLTRTDDASADLLVGYQAAVTQERQWDSYGMGGVGWRMGGGMRTATSTTISIGTVGVDMYDAAKKELVWRGSATKTIDPGANPQKRQSNIKKGAAKLFKKYPPPTSN